MRQNSRNTVVEEKGEGGGAPGGEAEIPLQPEGETTVAEVFPCRL